MSNPESGEDIPVSKLSQHVVVNMHNVPCRERRFGCIVYDENSQINLDLPQKNVTYRPGDKLEIKTNHLGILAAYEGFDHQSKIHISVVFVLTQLSDHCLFFSLTIPI